MLADAGTGFSEEELQLAARNHGMPLEALKYELTPLGLHYLLVHFDIPQVDGGAHRLKVQGQISKDYSVADLTAKPAVRLPVTLECAGNGRARLQPRAISQPWLLEAVGNSEWTGTPLGGVLDEVGIPDSALEVLFTGLDRGVQGDVPHEYQRSLPLAEALREEVILSYAMNGQPLLPQHGAPLRLIVPGWYGMTHVKWLARIEFLTEPFDGFQQVHSYRIRKSDEDPGIPIERILPRSLLVPPGVPVFLTRQRLLDAGDVVLTGRAWSGFGPIGQVEVSVDGGTTWSPAVLGQPLGPYSWVGWSFRWNAQPGEYLLSSRATDASGRVQPLEPEWNVGGYQNNSVQLVPVTVS